MQQIIPENAIAFSGIIFVGDVGKKVMAPVQSRMGAILVLLYIIFAYSLGGIISSFS